MPKPWQYRKQELLNQQPYKLAFEINDQKAREAGGCWSEGSFCDDTDCACADTALGLAKSELNM
jgi:hypothetical protein